MKIIPGVRHTEEEMYDMDEDELIRLANEQLAQANPEPVDPNPSGRNTENQGLAGHFDGTIFPDRMHRSPTARRRAAASGNRSILKFLDILGNSSE